jgi:hypothetical protein
MARAAGAEYRAALRNPSVADSAARRGLGLQLFVAAAVGDASSVEQLAAAGAKIDWRNPQQVAAAAMPVFVL